MTLYRRATRTPGTRRVGRRRGPDLGLWLTLSKDRFPYRGADQADPKEAAGLAERVAGQRRRGPDTAVPSLATQDRIIGMLGPRMIELAGRRAAGIRPFPVTPDRIRG
ncbi:hypothetical protein ACFY2Q_08860 [Micromonospora sp. NPDC000316]|uniref:hypothetical protein n=1 Tax=Micromonospora sp. NPDC000316 TaxID=3364216 RepID=UPI00369026EF